MPISDKNRKILWAKSGNRCAICRHQLVLDPTALDLESVIGDECHIHSGAHHGPRYDPNLPQSEIDNLSNLILLCRIHHKMVDDQAETYSADLLKGIKANHEKWVEEKLKDQPDMQPVRIKRMKDKIPQKLPIIRSGKELVNLAMGCHASYQDYDDDLNDEETDLVGGFIQNISDCIDVLMDFEPLARIQTAKFIDNEIKLLNERAFIVFAAVEEQIIEGGISSPSAFRVLHLAVKRISDPGIVISDYESL